MRYWYLIENEKTEWFKAGFFWDESLPGQKVGRMVPTWTKNTENATLFPSRWNAETYMRKHELNGTVTEHEFVNP